MNDLDPLLALFKAFVAAHVRSESDEDPQPGKMKTVEFAKQAKISQALVVKIRDADRGTIMPSSCRGIAAGFPREWRAWLRLHSDEWEALKVDFGWLAHTEQAWREFVEKYKPRAPAKVPGQRRARQQRRETA